MIGRAVRELLESEEPDIVWCLDGATTWFTSSLLDMCTEDLLDRCAVKVDGRIYFVDENGIIQMDPVLVSLGKEG